MANSKVLTYQEINKLRDKILALELTEEEKGYTSFIVTPTKEEAIEIQKILQSIRDYKNIQY